MRNAYLNTFEALLAPAYKRELDAHVSGLYHPKTPFEVALVHLFVGWLKYADEHKWKYKSGIGQDGVLGEEWAKIGQGLRGLLTGETGCFDCGALDKILADTLRGEGFAPETLCVE